jgi:hypothetical protein
LHLQTVAEEEEMGLLHFLEDGLLRASQLSIEQAGILSIPPDDTL